MRPRWEDVDARARGLGSRLLALETITGLSRVRGIGPLGRALAAHGVLPEESAAGSATELGLALRRTAARQVAILRRWLGPRNATLAVALDAEDRRSLRALIRGAAEGASADARLAGLVPTPELPERLLVELARRVSIREQAVLLVAAGHPCGAPVLAVVTEAEPDLFRIEVAIVKTMAARAVRGSRDAGRFLRSYVTMMIDHDNCRTALVLAATGNEGPVAPLFLPGGSFRLQEFERAAETREPASAARVLGEAVPASGLSSILLRHALSPAALEEALEERALGTVRGEARVDPLGPAPVLLYLLRLRRQTVALARLIWSAELGVPPALAGPEVA